jgi:hypothetical protein
LVGDPEGKKQIGRPKLKRKIIKSSRNRIGIVDWVCLAEDWNEWWAFANTVMNFRVP